MIPAGDRFAARADPSAAPCHDGAVLHRLLYPARLDSAAGTLAVRRAQPDDLTAMRRLLASDPVAANRFDDAPPASGRIRRDAEAEHPYLVGFTRILLDPGNELVVAEDADFAVVAMMQLTLIPGFSRRGASRLHLSAFRVAPGAAADAHARAMLDWARTAAARLDAALVQTAVDATGVDARRTLEAAGFTGAEIGYRISAAPASLATA